VRDRRAELRADFRRTYHVGLAESLELDPCECADLAAHLPDGSLSVGAEAPQLSWTRSEYLLASCANTLMSLASGLGGGKVRPRYVEPPRPPEPGDGESMDVDEYKKWLGIE
jgi:hypothetical protein